MKQKINFEIDFDKIIDENAVKSLVLENSKLKDLIDDKFESSEIQELIDIKIKEIISSYLRGDEGKTFIISYIKDRLDDTEIEELVDSEQITKALIKYLIREK